jgi:tetratricopeptide (TPR) repeat protein
VYEVGEFEDGVWLAMELVEGPTLRAHLDAGTRSWGELQSIFVGAARGLAAAHAAGLVHRDFKPSNVLLGDDSRSAGTSARVRVADFGLALALDRRDSDQGGASPGTPAYMAPEQLRGEDIDARADQFAVCVVLFEALHGRRPFAGDRPEELLAAIERGPRWSERSAPSWLRRTVLRGLEIDPARRFSSMDEVAQRLEHRRPLGRHLAVVIAAGASAGLAYAWARPDPPGPCARSDAAIASVWNDERAQQLERAATAAGPVAEAGWKPGRAAIDDWAERWSAARRAACIATLETRERTEHAFELSAACLDRTLVELDALLSALAEATDDSDRWSRSRAAAAELPDVDRCHATDVLAMLDPPPDDPRVAALRDALADCTAALRLGDYVRAGAAIDPLVAEAQALGHRPLVAEALFVAGSVAQVRRDADGAERALRDALWIAEAVRHEEVAAEAATALVEVVGALQRRPERALEWAEHARAANERIGAADGTTLRLAHALAQVALVHGRAADAVRHAEEELALAGDDAYWRAGALATLASAEGAADRPHEASAHAQEAVELARSIWGEAHPNVAALHNNLGNLHADLHDDHRALEHYRLAIDSWTASLGADDVRIATARMNTATVLKRLGRWSESRAELERALPVLREQLGADHPDVAAATTNYCNVLRGQGEIEAARAQCAAAVASFRRASPQAPHEIAVALLALGQVELAAAAPARAVPILLEARVRADAGELHAEVRAEINYELGRAQLSSDPEAARTSVRIASAVLAEAPTPDAELHGAIERWLAEHAAGERRSAPEP